VDPQLSGVGNRNHCPYCLWSKHLDLHRAGDRLCACKGAMQPLALTVKRTQKRYARNGELMLVHHCTECGQLSINRIAADDDSETLLRIFRNSLGLAMEIQQEIHKFAIQLVKDEIIIRRQLYLQPAGSPIG
jgi:hypothetical protein